MRLALVRSKISETASWKPAMALIREDIDLIEPFPDVVALFLHFNETYFDGELTTTSVHWSSERMTRHVKTSPPLITLWTR